MDITNVEFVEETGNYTQAGPSYKRTYRVDFKNGYSTAALIHHGRDDLPSYGDIHPDDTAAFANQIDPKMVDGDDQQEGSAWYIVSYAALVNQYQLNPLSRPPEIDWGGEAQGEVMYIDLDGKPCVNSAGDRYDPQPEREVLGSSVNITRFEKKNPALVIEEFSLTSNEDPFGIRQPGEAKIGIITARLVYENGAPFWSVRYPIAFNRKGWNFMPVDNGHRKLLSDGKTRRRCHDDMGNTSPVPVLLDGKGNELLPTGTPPVLNPVIFPEKGYKRYERVEWATLNLPDPFK